MLCRTDSLKTKQNKTNQQQNSNNNKTNLNLFLGSRTRFFCLIHRDVYSWCDCSAFCAWQAKTVSITFSFSTDGVCCPFLDLNFFQWANPAFSIPFLNVNNALWLVPVKQVCLCISDHGAVDSPSRSVWITLLPWFPSLVQAPFFSAFSNYFSSSLTCNFSH